MLSSVLDPVQSQLDPTVWDSAGDIAPSLKPKHAAWIIRKVWDTLESNGYAKPEQWGSLYLTGSLTTYQYSPDSDCDVSLFVDTAVFPEWSRAELFGILVSHIDGTLLPGTSHPMQCYVVPQGLRPEDLYKPGMRSGWDILEHRWVVPPERDRVHDVQQEYSGFYTWAEEQADKMSRLLKYEPDKARLFYQQIHRKRKRDMEAGKGDYSESNILYKFLDKRGLLPAQAGYEAKTADVYQENGLRIPVADTNHQAILDSNRGQNLQGLPGPVNVPGYGPLQFHSHAGIQQVANQYNQANGLGPHPTDYTRVNPQTAQQIAQEYEQMQHNPNDPTVKAAYDALARETRAQYDHAVRNGYQFEFYPQHDPYPNSPREAVLDLHHNKHMYVYPTEQGYGQEGQDPQDHPLLADSGVRWNGRPVTHNDLFRAIHDFYGHAKEGLGFRHDGEDNAYRQHASMFSPLARRALASETRGQNSWVNFGPHGASNQTAGQGDTVYAEQKAGLMPEWTGDIDLHRPTTSSWVFSAIEPYEVDHNAVQQAAQHLGLNAPVHVNVVGGAQGRYQGLQDGRHVIDLVSWLRPESASKQIWHEMTHAKQFERDPQNWQRELGQYMNTYAQGHEAYRAHPWEVEARQVANSHPFMLTRETQHEVPYGTQIEPTREGAPS